MFHFAGCQVQKTRNFFILLVIFIYSNSVYAINIGMPRILLSDIHTSNEPIAGEEFNLYYTLNNISDSELKNILITFNSLNYTILPANGISNAQFIETIPAGESISGDILLRSSLTLQSGLYPIDISLEFEDPQNNIIKSQELISVLITQPYIFDVENISIVETAYMNEQIPLTIRYANNGSDNIKNLSFVFEGENIPAPQKNLLVGDIEAGYSGYVDCEISFNDVGEQTLSISYEFDTSDGVQEHVLIEEGKINVISSSADYGIDNDIADVVTERQDQGTFDIGLVVSLLLVTLSIVVFIKKYVLKPSNNKPSNKNGKA